MKKRHLFLTLNTFSATGGIEKVCRNAAKAIYEATEDVGDKVAVFSMYDTANSADERYIPLTHFKGFDGKRIAFIANSVKVGINANVVILSHINLVPVGYLIKLLSPKTRIILLAHGIEVWEILPKWKKKILGVIDLFLPVSRYTANKLELIQGISPLKIQTLNNCLDPFLANKRDVVKEGQLKVKYGISENDFVLFTLARLKFSEQYKGYDKVIEALASMKNHSNRIKYLIVGRYDAEEKDRLEKIISTNKLTDQVIFAGFVPDEDIASHFHLSDVYIMPSRCEGFGIVFIEALYYGKPVIAGNADGSVDALDNGRFGILVNPVDIGELMESIDKTISQKHLFIPKVDEVTEKFGFENYKHSLKKILSLNNQHV